MKIKVINPNTTVSMTEKISLAAQAVANPTTEIIATSPSMGPVSIEGHYDEALAVVGLLEEIRKGEAEGVDGYVIACFGDPGLLAARELTRSPVIGIAEAAMHAASLISTSFSIVTTLSRTRIIARHLVENYGMNKFCRNIRSTDLAVLEIETDANARKIITGECRKALVEDGAEAIVLGCSGMADLAQEISQEIGAPVIDGVGAAVKFVEVLVSLGLETSKVNSLAFPIPKPYTGILQSFTVS